MMDREPRLNPERAGLGRLRDCRVVTSCNNSRSREVGTAMGFGVGRRYDS
jgi:hypothetical protein